MYINVNEIKEFGELYNQWLDYVAHITATLERIECGEIVESIEPFFPTDGDVLKREKVFNILKQKDKLVVHYPEHVAEFDMYTTYSKLVWEWIEKYNDKRTKFSKHCSKDICSFLMYSQNYASMVRHILLDNVKITHSVEGKVTERKIELSSGGHTTIVHQTLYPEIKLQDFQNHLKAIRKMAKEKGVKLSGVNTYSKKIKALFDEYDYTAYNKIAVALKGEVSNVLDIQKCYCFQSEECEVSARIDSLVKQLWEYKVISRVYNTYTALERTYNDFKNGSYNNGQTIGFRVKDF